MSSERSAWARIAAVAGWTFVATSVVLIVLAELTVRAAGQDASLVPAAGEFLRRGGVPAGMVTGTIAFFCLLADLSRHPDLRSRRARLRGAQLATLLLAAAWGATLPFPRGGLAALPPEAVPAVLADAARWRLGHVVLTLAFAALHLTANRLVAPRVEVDAEGRYAAGWVPPVFGATPRLPARQWQVLALLVVVGAFNHYDHQVLSLALKDIQADLGISEARVGLVGSIVLLGAVPGAVLALLADSLGRRRILLVTIVGYTLATGATAFAPTTETFIVCQVLARAFGAAEGVVAGVVLVEEIDAPHRGWAIGVLVGMAAIGNAVAWLLFPFMEGMPMGWRSLFLIGLGPLAVVAWLRRRLPETERFERQHADDSPPGWREMLEPVRALARAYPERVAMAVGAGFLMSFSGRVAGFLFPKFLRETHGMDPAELTLAVAAAGFIGLCSGPILGRTGDRFGRRRVVVFLAALNPLTVILLYNAPLLSIAMLGFLTMMVTDAGADRNFAAFQKELFPTSHRATAVAALAIVGNFAGSLSLAAESAAYAVTGDHGQAVGWVAATGLLVPFVVWAFFPETAGKSLEETAPERSGPR